MKKVLVNHALSDSLIKKLIEKHKDYNFIVFKNEEEMNEYLSEAEILISWCTKDMLDRAPKLKWIQVLSAGVDAMPLDEIKKRGIILTNGRGIHKIQMSEYAIGAMITLSRNFHLMFRNQMQGKWDNNIFQSEIFNSTVGILGLGSIGKEVAKKASQLGMHVVGLKNEAFPVEFVDFVYEYEHIKEVFTQSDYIINLLPNTKETQGLISKKYFNMMKPSSCFINIGRGKTVNETDLVEALQNKKIRAAMLDVFDEEPLSKDSPLWELENVIITPHICGNSVHYMERALEIVEHNLNAYLNKNLSMISLVDLNKGY